MVKPSLFYEKKQLIIFHYSSVHEKKQVKNNMIHEFFSDPRKFAQFFANILQALALFLAPPFSSLFPFLVLSKFTTRGSFNYLVPPLNPELFVIIKKKHLSTGHACSRRKVFLRIWPDNSNCFVVGWKVCDKFKARKREKFTIRAFFFTAALYTRAYTS